MERERERENQRVMDDQIQLMFTGPTSHGEVMFTGPTRSDYEVVVDSEFPRQIQNHPFHPSHPLFLVKEKDFDGNRCNSCRLYCGEGIFFYRCDLCDFDLDTNCAKLTPTIKYVGHPDHLLSLFNIDYSDFNYPCKACKEKCDGHVLRCVPCNFNLHLHCLPHKIKHKNHCHFFTLTASIKEEDRGINELVCYECTDKINPDEPVYYCAKCYFPLHIACSSEAIADHDDSGPVSVTEGERMMRLRRSVEELTTNLNKQKEAMVKLMNDVEVKTTYLNRQKKYLKTLQFLERETPHKEISTKFPPKIKHPFHSQHPLTLTLGRHDSIVYDCSVCMKHNDGFRYNCFDCDFFLDLNCVLRKPTIKYDGHQEHLLIFLKKNYGNHNRCNACQQYCETSPIVRCADCDFNLHIDCFPSLPPTFRNPQCHLHALTLTDSFAGDLTTDEYYCDFCEDERDPKLPVYYCKECPYVAHVTCVLYEELPLILAELDSTKRDGVVEESVFVDVSNDKIEDEVADEDPTLAKIEDENLTLAKIEDEDEVEDENLTLAKIDAEMRKHQLKLEELQEKRARYLARVI